VARTGCVSSPPAFLEAFADLDRAATAPCFFRYNKRHNSDILGEAIEGY
jgi:hypothetical protein